MASTLAVLGRKSATPLVLGVVLVRCCRRMRGLFGRHPWAGGYTLATALPHVAARQLREHLPQNGRDLFSVVFAAVAAVFIGTFRLWRITVDCGAVFLRSGNRSFGSVFFCARRQRHRLHGPVYSSAFSHCAGRIFDRGSRNPSHVVTDLSTFGTERR